MSRKTSPKKTIPDIPEAVPSLTFTLFWVFRWTAVGQAAIWAGTVISLVRMVLFAVAGLIVCKHLDLPAWVSRFGRYSGLW